MRIGIDFDGVLADFPTGFLDKYVNPALESRNQPTMTPNDIKEWKFEKSIPLNPMVTETLYRKAIAEGLFNTLPPYRNGLVPLIRELDLRGHHIYYITSRDAGTITDTYKWMQKWRIPFANGVYFGENKKDICEMLGIDVMVEDLYEQAKPISEVVDVVILVKQPWNNESFIKEQNIHCTNYPASALENIVLGPKCDF